MIDDKEKQVVPLNLNIDLRRLTQLFGRSLYIKYFIKPVEPELLRRRSLNNRLGGDRNAAIHRGDDDMYGNVAEDHDIMDEIMQATGGN